MPYDNYSVNDCDGHFVESVPEMAEFMSARIKRHALTPARNHQGVFPSLDGMHLALHEENALTKKRIIASEYRPGSGEDWLAFLDRAKIERTVLFTSEGLSVGFIQAPKYAVEVCRAYNDYVYHRFAKLSDRLRPMALIPMQDVAAAISELRRAVKELGLAGAMLPSCGLPLHLAHETYWPIYEEAEKLDCPLALHGGANCQGAGLETFTCFAYASDYPHEVDLPAAQHEIEEVAERKDLTVEERQAILADNARRFFKLRWRACGASRL